MTPHVNLQFGAKTETLCALVTLVGLLGVSLHVVRQGALMFIALRALVTLVGPLPIVSPHVDLQYPASTETPHALVTLEGFLLGVNPHVGLQFVAMSEALCALVTLVALLPIVSPHVDLQVAFPFEALNAFVTPVRLLGVGIHVGGARGVHTQTL